MELIHEALNEFIADTPLRGTVTQYGLANQELPPHPPYLITSYAPLHMESIITTNTYTFIWKRQWFISDGKTPSRSALSAVWNSLYLGRPNSALEVNGVAPPPPQPVSWFFCITPLPPPHPPPPSLHIFTSSRQGIVCLQAFPPGGSGLLAPTLQV